jgi:hypothetical protein
MSEIVIHKALATMPAAGDAGPLAGETEAEAARDRALINTRFALVPLAPEEVDLRRMRLANDRVDRTYERFSPAFLARLAATIVGKSVLAHHKKSAFPLGRFYAAEVVLEARSSASLRSGSEQAAPAARGSELEARSAEQHRSEHAVRAAALPLRAEAEGRAEPERSDIHWLVARYYMLRSEATAELRRQIDAGVYSYVSIGFRGGVPRCDLCANPFTGACPHWPGRVYETPAADRVCTLTWEDPDGSAEAVEGSLVWLGAQIGAQHVKGWRESLLTTEARSTVNLSPGPSPKRGGVPEARGSCLGAKWLASAHGGQEARLPLPEAGRGLEGEVNPRKEDGMDRDHPLAAAQERIAQLEREVAEYRERAAEAARWEPLARDGERYRADLVAEITRLAGLVGAAKEAAFLCESLSAAGAERLKELKAEYERRVEEKLPPQGAGRPTDDPRPASIRDPRAHSVV